MRWRGKRRRFSTNPVELIHIEARDAFADGTEDFVGDGIKELGNLDGGDRRSVVRLAEQDHLISNVCSRNVRNVKQRKIHADASHDARAVPAYDGTAAN